MKKLPLILFLMPALLATAQKNAKPPAKTASASSDKITLVCKLWSVPVNTDSVNVYELGGLANRVVARGGRRLPDSAFVVVLPASEPRFYGVGMADNALARVVLGREKEVTLWANCAYMEKARTVNSPANKAYEQVQRRIEEFQSQSDILRTQYFNADGNQGAAARQPVEAQVKELAAAKKRFLDSLKTADPMLWRSATLQVAPEYIAEKAAHSSEFDFYGNHYFRHADLGDKAYDETPDVYNGFERFVTKLTQVATPTEKLNDYITLQLAKIPAKSKAYRMAMGGVVSALKTGNGTLYPVYAAKYVELYRNNSMGEIGRLEYEMKRASTFMPGFEAPDLAGMTPDSSTFSLKKLRGKVVMIDFWASWCGPCRKENPNVVANYKKYKDKGFDILGVSLDKDLAAWRKAIATDGLPWHHISDLKGWQSEHAALYSVSSIPQTLLLDRDGRIIARNLRGEQLGEKLREIFGE